MFAKLKLYIRAYLETVKNIMITIFVLGFLVFVIWFIFFYDMG